MAARIYADVKGGLCSCGGAFSKRVPHPDDKLLIVPRCDKCDQYPQYFLIDADGRNPNGSPLRFKIRNDQNNNRLERIGQVVFTIESVQREILDGTFDVTRYCSKESRESFKFKNYVEEYMKAQDLKLVRSEITPKGLRDKKGLIDRELLPYFGSMDITKITAGKIRTFQKSYTHKFRTRDLALGELKTILRQAVVDELLKVAPVFDKIPKAKTRTTIISMDLARKTIEAMPREMYRDMFTLLLLYPMRPSELRGLRWKDIDFVNDKIWIRGHFSNEVWIMGRKSVKEGEKSELDFPLKEKARTILNRYRPEVPSINWKDSYIFMGYTGRQVMDSRLSEAWNKARNLVGHKHHLYELRHRCLTEFAKKANGDIVKMMRVSGHTNPQTLMSRYIRDESDMADFF